MNAAGPQGSIAWPCRRAAGAILAAALALAPALARAQTIDGLHVDCRGPPTAAPTVILESGAFGTSADWARVLADLAAGGRVCAYDRSGVGQSARRHGPKDVVSVAEELASLLDAMGETRPVILVGHSNGALYAETFAALWPKRVAGLAYVNGVTSGDLADPALVRALIHERRLANLAALAGEIGLAPLAVGEIVGAETLPLKAARRKRRALSQPRRLFIARDEDRAIVPGLYVAAALGGSPVTIPTVVITSIPRNASVLDAHWQAAEAAPAMRARRGWVLILPGGTHLSPLSRDRAYVRAAVNWLRGLAYQTPTLGADAHGSAGARAAPF